MHKLVLEQKSEIESLSKKEAESHQTIEVLEERLKISQGMSPSCFRFRTLFLLFECLLP
jgi:hypothetical protein